MTEEARGTPTPLFLSLDNSATGLRRVILHLGEGRRVRRGSSSAAPPGRPGDPLARPLRAHCKGAYSLINHSQLRRTCRDVGAVSVVCAGGPQDVDGDYDDADR